MRETDDCHAGESRWPVHSCETAVYPLWQGAKTVSTDLTGGLIRSRWISKPWIRASVWRGETWRMWIELDRHLSLLHTVFSVRPALYSVTQTHECIRNASHARGSCKIHKHSYPRSYPRCFVHSPRAGHILSHKRFQCDTCRDLLWGKLNFEGIVYYLCYLCTSRWKISLLTGAVVWPCSKSQLLSAVEVNEW